MATKKDTVKDEQRVLSESNVAVAEGEKIRKQVAKQFKKQELVPVTIPPLYKPYFGRVMTITLQGTSVHIPCDGKTYRVPKSFAHEIMIRLDNQNELIEKKNRLGDVRNNFESSPGALELI